MKIRKAIVNLTLFICMLLVSVFLGFLMLRLESNIQFLNKDVGSIAGLILIFVLLTSAVLKITNFKIGENLRNYFGASNFLWGFISALEITFAIGIFFGLLSENDGEGEGIGFISAIGIITIMICATISLLNKDHKFKSMIIPFFVIILSVVYVILEL